MNDLKERTKTFSLTIITLIEGLPKTIAGKTIASQLVRSETSVGANHRAVCRSISDKEFIAKMNIVLEESDECPFWLEIIHYKKWIDENLVVKIFNEANELTAIFVASLKTMKNKLNS